MCECEMMRELCVCLCDFVCLCVFMCGCSCPENEPNLHEYSHQPTSSMSNIKSLELYLEFERLACASELLLCMTGRAAASNKGRKW